jgi:hypothetical protein
VLGRGSDVEAESGQAGQEPAAELDERGEGCPDRVHAGTAVL